MFRMIQYNAVASLQCNRRIHPLLAALAIGFFAVSGLSPRVSFSEELAGFAGPPNVVLIVADDLGYGELGCYGQSKIKTPALDSLAKDGMKFTHFYSGNAVCAPSRCCLMTGMHPGHAYIRNNGSVKSAPEEKAKFGWEFPGQNPIPDEIQTLAESFKKQGYATAAMGKWGLGHFGTSGDPNRQGFDLFFGFNCQVHAHNHYPKFLWRNDVKEIQPGNQRELSGATYSQDSFVSEGIAFIESNRERPFFLFLPFAVPHLSIQVPDESVIPYQEEIEEAPYKHTVYLEHPSPRAGYAAMVTRMDQGIQRILDRLDELELADNTIVLFTSDNGPTYNRLGGADSDFFESTAGLRGRKGSLYEGGIRVPLIVRWPERVAPGETSDVPAAFWDLMPTLVDMCGGDIPRGLDGVSLASILDGSSGRVERDYLYWEFPAYGGQQAIRFGGWKAIRTNLLSKDKAKIGEWELYDLESDPREQHDVAADHPDLLKQVRQWSQEARTTSTLFPFPILDQ